MLTDIWVWVFFAGFEAFTALVAYMAGLNDGWINGFQQRREANERPL